MENICYVSVNHGVVSDALGRSILPSYASHQACWSRAQAIELGQFNKNKIDIEKQHNIVFFDIGVPTSTSLKVEHRIKKDDNNCRVLLAFGGHLWTNREKLRDYATSAQKVAKLLRQKNCEVFISIHPQDKDNEEWRQLIKRYGWINVSTLNKTRKLEIDAAIGANTSLLTETAELGIPSFHLLEFS